MTNLTNFRKQGLLVIVASFLWCFSGTTALADSTFTDNSFNPVNYTATTVFLSNLSLSLSVSQCASCGNPGQGLQFVGTAPTPGTIAVGLVNNNFVYDPSTQGALSSVDASVDKNLTVNTMGTYGNTFRPLIEQDGMVYLAAIPGPQIVNGTSTGYNTIFQTGLSATDFLSYDFTTGTFGSANPNFNGDPMFFGLGQIFGTAGVNNISLEADYDNLSLTAKSVPEPGSLLLLVVGLLGVFLAAHNQTRASISGCQV